MRASSCSLHAQPLARALRRHEMERARDVGEARTVAVEARTAIERRPRERERARLRSIKDQPAERGHGVVACAVRGDELW